MESFTGVISVASAPGCGNLVAFLLKTIEGDSNAQERVQRLPWSASTSQLSSPETHPCNTSAGGETTINHCHNNITYCDDINFYKSVVYFQFSLSSPSPPPISSSTHQPSPSPLIRNTFGRFSFRSSKDAGATSQGLTRLQKRVGTKTKSYQTLNF